MENVDYGETDLRADYRGRFPTATEERNPSANMAIPEQEFDGEELVDVRRVTKKSDYESDDTRRFRTMISKM